jgi:hypothetical protein
MAVLHLSRASGEPLAMALAPIRTAKVEEFLETIGLPRDNLEFVRVSPLTYSFAEGAQVWPDLVSCVDKRRSQSLRLPDRFI